jgi:peptidoglycan/xylan/chitin deacetylase (PgdA/CDA1 family)
LLRSATPQAAAVAAATAAAIGYLSMLPVAFGASPGQTVAPTSSQTSALQIARVVGGAACVALTFDDGPDPTLTPKILSELEAKSAVATFFVVGSRVQQWPDPVRQAAADGDEIGNHSWDHPVLPSLGNDAVVSELTRTDAVINKAIGHDPDVARAPYGSMSPRVASLSPRRYIAWNIDTLDWKYPDANYITNAALKAVSGSIILMHDIHPRTVDAVPGIIDGLRARGFQLVTVAQLLSGTCGGQQVAFGEQAPGEGPPPPPAAPKVASSQVAAKPASAVPVRTNTTALATTAARPAAATDQPRYTLFDGE